MSKPWRTWLEKAGDMQSVGLLMQCVVLQTNPDTVSHSMGLLGLNLLRSHLER